MNIHLVIRFVLQALFEAILVAIPGLLLRRFIKNTLLSWGLAFMIVVILMSMGRGSFIGFHDISILFVSTGICLLVDIYWRKKQSTSKSHQKRSTSL